MLNIGVEHERLRYSPGDRLLVSNDRLGHIPIEFNKALINSCLVIVAGKASAILCYDISMHNLEVVGP